MLTLVIRRGKTALHLAVKYGRPIDSLLKIKVDVNTKDECACFAACCGFNVDLKVFCRYGQSPLELAKENKHLEYLAVLEAAGAT